MTSVCCTDCGYLAVRRFTDRDFVEVELFTRETGRHPDMPHGETQRYEQQPICFVCARTFSRDLRSEPASVFLKAIAGNRKCDQFTEWHQGYSPREHLDMNLLEQQRKRDEERMEQDHRWRDKQADREQQWRKEQAEYDRRCRQEDVKVAEESRKQADIAANEALKQANDSAKEALRQANRHHFFSILVTLMIAVGGIVATLVSSGVFW